MTPIARFLYMVFSFLLFTLASGSPLRAQETLSQKSTPEPIVKSIDIEFQGAQEISKEAISAHFRLRPGMPFNEQLLDQSIRSLYETGLYEFIQVIQNREPTGELTLTYLIVPKYRVSAISFNGVDKSSISRLLKKMETKQGGILDEVQIKRDRDTIFDWYQAKGYSLVKVDYVVDRDESLGSAILTINVETGKRIHIKAIRFEGNNHISAKTLRKQMKTHRWRFPLSWLFGGGRLDEDELQEDLDHLLHYYKEQGFLDVEIAETKVSLTFPSSHEMVIVIPVQEGRRYHVGNLFIQGNTLYPTSQLRRLLSLKTGDVFCPSVVDDNAEAIRMYYGRSGYLDAYVQGERRPNLQTGNIDLIFLVKEGDPFRVESIHLHGNTKTKSTVIVRELALAPGDLFDMTRMQASQNRLQNTRFFEEVTLSPETTTIPGRRNLRINVKEGRTGSLDFGAGFSKLESISGFIEVSQGNFDLFNYRNYFQGDGQKFRLRFSMGTESSQVLLSFEEPWLFQRELSAGFELYRTESEFLSSYYDELRNGAHFYLRKRLYELIDGQLSYTVEDVKISNVRDGAPNPVKKEAGHSSVSKIGLILNRDTRDNLVIPTQGSKLELFQEWAGGILHGESEYYRVEVRGSRYWPVFPNRTHVFSIGGRTGVITPYEKGASIPYFDRYFLGGPYNLRGFSFRSVGPRDGDEPLGGDTMAWGSAEYSFELMDPIRLALFYDCGFLNKKAFDWNPRYNDNWGIGLRILILGAPLRLDFAFPITATNNRDRGFQFCPSFSTSF